MTDIVERLRSDKPLIHRSDIDDAVRELDRLNAQTLELVREIERLRGLLRDARDGDQLHWKRCRKWQAEVDAALGSAVQPTDSGTPKP